MYSKRHGVVKRGLYAKKPFKSCRNPPPTHPKVQFKLFINFKTNVISVGIVRFTLRVYTIFLVYTSKYILLYYIDFLRVIV